MDREENLFEERKYSRSDQAMPLEQTLVGMLRSALAWEEQYGSPVDALSPSTTLSTPAPLNEIPQSSETEDQSHS